MVPRQLGRATACALIVNLGAAVAPAVADPIVISGSQLGGLFSLGGSGTALNSISIGNASSATGGSAVGLGTSAVANALGATAVGAGATVTGAAGTALGQGALAGDVGSVALGAGAVVNGATGVALGQSATAGGSGALALGGSAAAAGLNSVALGLGATAQQAGSVALGNGAIAAQANSIAVGVGAVTTRANQIAVGSGTSTYTLAGINSLASINALNGPTSVVISDSGGNLATTTVNLSALNNVSVLDSRVTNLDNRVSNLEYGVAVLTNDVNKLKGEVRKGFEGTAIALALGGTNLPEGKRFAVSGGFGTFQGENAFGASAAVRVSDNILFNGGIGAGLSRGGVGGRGAMTLAW